MTKATSHNHPLDPLAAQEVEACSRACASHAADAGYKNVRFNLISLKVSVQVRSQNPRSLPSVRSAAVPLAHKYALITFPDFIYVFMQEPAKAELIAYDADKSAVPARTAYCIVQAFPKSPVNEVEVELSGDSAKVRSWKQVHASADDPDGKPELHTHFVSMHTGNITLPCGASSAKSALNRNANIIWLDHGIAMPSDMPLIDDLTIIVTEASLVEAWWTLSTDC